jgi:hypothetical protein
LLAPGPCSRGVGAKRFPAARPQPQARCNIRLRPSVWSADEELDNTTAPMERGYALCWSAGLQPARRSAALVAFQAGKRLVGGRPARQRAANRRDSVAAIGSLLARSSWQVGGGHCPWGRTGEIEFTKEDRKWDSWRGEDVTDLPTPPHEPGVVCSPGFSLPGRVRQAKAWTTNSNPANRTDAADAEPAVQRSTARFRSGHSHPVEARGRHSLRRGGKRSTISGRLALPLSPQQGRNEA